MKRKPKERMFFPHGSDRGITLKEWAETIAMAGLLSNIDIVNTEYNVETLKINCKLIIPQVLEHVYPDGFDK